MPFKLEHFGDKAIVVNTRTGKEYSRSPIPLHSAQKQMRILEHYREMKEELRGYKDEKKELRKMVEK